MPQKTPFAASASRTNFSPLGPCPCGSGGLLQVCCLPYIQGAKSAPTAEALMRSRYTAHVLLAIDYLWSTWAEAGRIHSSPEQVHAWAVSCEWLGLEIIATDKGGENDPQGIVSFIARFRQGGKAQEHREISRFVREQGQWRYLDQL